MTRYLILILLLSGEAFVFEGESHHEIVQWYAYGECRKQGQRRSNYTLEDSHESRLHAHVDEVTHRESEPFLGVRGALEREETREQEIGHEADGIAYDCTDHSRHTYGVQKHDIHAILKHRAEATGEREANNLGATVAAAQ